MFTLVFAVIAAIILFERTIFNRKYKSIRNKHVVVTGGSSGIGKCVAKLAVRYGAHVTIIGRDCKKLDTAVEEIQKGCYMVGQKVQGVSLDVCDYELVKAEFSNLEEKVGPIYMLVNCAGLAICGKLENVSNEDIKTLLNTNFLGTVYPTKMVITKMKERKEGIVVITASQAALVGIYGLSIYSASKFALRGFAEALDMEMYPYNVSVTVALPPDTDTPGFEMENKTKPTETTLICGSGGIYKPEAVAQNLIEDALRGSFFSTVGCESYFTALLCVGMTRCTSLGELIAQVVLMGPLRVVGCIFLEYFYAIIRKCLYD
ncbi:hypothetical protein ILUMI_25321 [Ignelater luminosus]|uniref:3-dehydrosphinganine reductase n=1 Tax=Ignelater luminosus TaxID=2038154 RepID=A0A8K0CAS5_IGNLU|nr:hypothetical protein ILUMI_25321 [Ignelater luminosus]